MKDGLFKLFYYEHLEILLSLLKVVLNTHLHFPYSLSHCATSLLTSYAPATLTNYSPTFCILYLEPTYQLPTWNMLITYTFFPNKRD